MNTFTGHSNELAATYEAYGCSSRQSYLERLADEFGLDVGTVVATANLYGPNEDFEGLVAALEDIALA